MSAGSVIQCVSYCDIAYAAPVEVFYHKCHICTEKHMAESTLPLLPGSVYYEVGMYLLTEQLMFIDICWGRGDNAFQNCLYSCKRVQACLLLECRCVCHIVALNIFIVQFENKVSSVRQLPVLLQSIAICIRVRCVLNL